MKQANTGYVSALEMTPEKARKQDIPVEVTQIELNEVSSTVTKLSRTASGKYRKRVKIIS